MNLVLIVHDTNLSDWSDFHPAARVYVITLQSRSGNPLTRLMRCGGEGGGGARSVYPDPALPSAALNRVQSRGISV